MEFEKPILDLDARLTELRALTGDKSLNIADEVARLEAKAEKLLRQTYSHLTPAQTVQVARHPLRPHGLAYVERLFTDFTPLSGDRQFAEDRAIIAGLGRFRGQSVAVLAQEKGADTDTRLKHNFGMAKPEGYRKAVRIMQLAERFGLPLLSFVDTSGAFPGVEAEARGQSEAIARAIDVALDLTIPSIATVIGEGGSGGAVAIATADRVLMLEHAVYSVISPEGCASILWRSAANAAEAASALRLTAPDLLKLGVIDAVIPEPLGGAHRQPAAAIAAAGDAVASALADLMPLDGPQRRRLRREKFLGMGQKAL